MKTVTFDFFVVHSFLALFFQYSLVSCAPISCSLVLAFFVAYVLVCGSLVCHSLFFCGSLVCMQERVLNKLKDLGQFLVRCGPKYYNHAGSL